jgi:glycosyltransferase involved in cell wall biosynthesis
MVGQLEVVRVMLKETSTPLLCGSFQGGLQDVGRRKMSRIRVGIVGAGIAREGLIGCHVREFHRFGVTCRMAYDTYEYVPRHPVISWPELGVEAYNLKCLKCIPLNWISYQNLSRVIRWADLVHVYHTAYPTSGIGALMAWFHRKPLVVTTADHVVYKGLHCRLSSYVPWLLADRIVAYVEGERQWLSSVGVKPDRVSLIPLGIDVDRHAGHHQSRRQGSRRGVEKGYLEILFAGRKHPDKNLHTLVRCAVRAARQSEVPVRLTLVGREHDVRYAVALRRLIAALHAEDIIHYVAEVRDRDAFLDHYVNADLFVDIAAYGAFEVVVLEAMAFELPVVVSHTVGAAEIVAREDCGIVVGPLNEGEIVNALLALVRDEDRRRRLGQAGYQAVCERYSYRQMAGQLAALYQALVQP